MDDYNPTPVEVFFAKSEEQAKKNGSSRCLYPEFPDSRRIYSAMTILDESFYISKHIGWERIITIRKADVPTVMQLWYPDGTGEWEYEKLISQIDGNTVWIIGYGD